MSEDNNKTSNFIQQIIEKDLESGKHAGVVTRFPPEPNGFLHLGHAKSICLNFGVAQAHGGTCHLRFDDTNPTKEEQKYVDSIQEDVKWLGFDWGDKPYYTSDNFEQLYQWAVQLIEQGDAYVDDQSPEVIREQRGTVMCPGDESPCRTRSAAENKALFARMRAGEFADGSCVLRAKIDMASPNMLLRDPILYRIYQVSHPRTGDTWCIYPMYDFAHGQCDSLEGITHSICTLEFEVHRPLYEWLQERLDIPRTRQIEFARLNVSGMVMSKRKLKALVEEKVVDGWDDPRMPTIAGMRRRGYTPAAIRQFCDTIGVARRDNVIEQALLEHCLRTDLNKVSQRRNCVVDPLKVTIRNWPEGKVDMIPAINNPENEADGTREIPFAGELYIEKADYKENASRKFFRLTEGREVRLRYGYWIKCEEAIKDDNGEVVELICTYDPDTRGGEDPKPDEDGKIRKVKGTLHWVSAMHAVPVAVRMYDRLFVQDESEVEDWREAINPESMQLVEGLAEPSLLEIEALKPVQFERIGYFTRDPEQIDGKVVFNRAVALRDTWAKKQK